MKKGIVDLGYFYQAKLRMLNVNKCPEAVEALISHLRDSGTGKGKLATLHKLGCECKTPESFLERAKQVLPEGTMKKITNFINSTPIAAEAATEVKVEVPKVVEQVPELKVPQSVVVKEQPPVVESPKIDPIPPKTESNPIVNKPPQPSYTSPRSIKGK
jgi:hypothetical protein